MSIGHPWGLRNTLGGMAKKREFQSLTELQEFFRTTGAQGGKKRAAKMTKAERSESAKKAALARWKKAKTKTTKQKKGAGDDAK